MLTAPDLQASRSELFEATLNALMAGVILARRDRHVVYMNAAAQHQIRMGRALRMINGRFSPTDPAAARALAQVLNADEMVRCGRTLALPDRFGAGVLVTILPLETGIGCRQPFATVAIFIQDPALTPPFPGEAFAKPYGLTSAELRVISAMAPGIMPHQVAEALGVGLQTIRTHLRNIFQKTGTARQGDVLALMARANGPANGA